MRMSLLYFLSGLQVWQDGGQYKGEFHHDMRHGEGELKWSNGEVSFRICFIIYNDSFISI